MKRPFQFRLKTVFWVTLLVAAVSWDCRPRHRVGNISWTTTSGVPGGIQTIEWMDGTKLEQWQSQPTEWRLEGEEIVLDEELYDLARDLQPGTIARPAVDFPSSLAEEAMEHPKQLSALLLQQLEHVIGLLEDLPPSEAAIGWDEPRVTNWLTVFGDLRESVLAGKRIPYACYIRGLDFDGICGGEIFDATAHIDETISLLEDWHTR